MNPLFTWQPIETAPKDGTSILVAGGTFNWDDGMGGNSNFEGVAHVGWYRDRWQGDCTGGYEQYFYYQPTHWMPLPAPPIAEGRP